MLENINQLPKKPNECFSISIATQIITFLRKNQSALIKEKGDAFSQIQKMIEKGFFVESQEENEEGFLKVNKQLFNEIIYLQIIKNIKNLAIQDQIREYSNQYLSNCLNKKQTKKTIKIKK